MTSNLCSLKGERRCFLCNYLPLSSQSHIAFSHSPSFFLMFMRTKLRFAVLENYNALGQIQISDLTLDHVKTNLESPTDFRSICH